jgi:2-isopropylmalate synthase
MGMGDRVLIFDTTLRDGEQAPGFSLWPEEKLEMARQLARLGVDVIEGGFPIASPGEFDAITRIAKEVRGPTICALARANVKDIEAAAGAVHAAEQARIHTFIATSPIHMARKLRMTPEEVIETTRQAVLHARSLVPEVEFSAEDATRSDVDFLCRIFETAIAAGATIINIPDTVGYAQPEEFGALVRTLLTRVPRMDRVTVSVHCHNDLGLASANTIAAILNGARRAECTINGIGERAGNASLEEVVMILRTREKSLGFRTAINTPLLAETSALVARHTGIAVQLNKAVVGGNAFAHASGIHQDGVLKDKLTYEIMRPEDVGMGESRIVLSPRSGRHAFRFRLGELGYHLPDAAFNQAWEEFLRLADRQKEILDRDLEQIVAGVMAAAS